MKVLSTVLIMITPIVRTVVSFIFSVLNVTDLQASLMLTTTENICWVMTLTLTTSFGMVPLTALPAWGKQ